MRTAEKGVLVGIVVAVAVALRVGFVTTANVSMPLRADAGQYAQYATNLCEHGVFSLSTSVPPPPDSFRSPGYPAVLALCRWLGGAQGWHALAVGLQVALGALTVLLAFRIARAVVGFGPALVAAACVALSPHLVVSTVYVLTECVTTFAVTAAVWLVVVAERGGRARLVAAAAATGAAVLCNETLVVLAVVLGAVLWSRGRARALTFTALALLPIALWTVRGQVQPITLRGSERVTASISHGSYPGMVFRDPRLRGEPYREDPEQPAFGASWGALFDVLGPRVAEAPWRHAVWYAVEKPVWLWGWPLVQGRDVYVYEVVGSLYERQPVAQATHALMRWLHVPTMVLAAATALLVWRRRSGAPWALRVLAAVAVTATLVHLPVIPDPRYLHPFRPVLFVLAAGGSVLAWGWLRRTSRAPRSEPATQPS